MKTISKPAALLLALTLALSLMACGDNGGAPDDGGADGDVPSGGDYTALAGDWYLDGDPAAESILSIAADGSWERTFTGREMDGCTAVCPAGSKVYFGAAGSASLLSARV